MKPPVCALCGSRFDPPDGGGTVKFSDYEPLPDGMTGHPEGLEWFCERHRDSARSVQELGAAAAMEQLRKKHWFAALLGRIF